MSAKILQNNLDWILEKQRDIELTDPVFTPIFDEQFDHLSNSKIAKSQWLFEDWKSIAGHINSLLDGYTGCLSIHGPFIGIPTFAADLKLRDLCRLRFNQALEFAGEIGATQMVIHSPFEFFGDAFVPHTTDKSLDEIIALSIDLFSEVLSHAEEAQCVLVFENTYDKRPGPLVKLVRQFDSPLVKCSVDLGHAYLTHRQGGTPADRWISETGDLLAHTHLHDNDGAADRHWPVGRGDINWYAVFCALDILPAMPRLIIESQNPQWAAKWLSDEGFAQ
jgi:sugar phosphate isomerase/epimerase